MPNVLIRDVPDDVHAELIRRASDAGQSLQLYLRSELERLARTPTLDQVLARIDAYPGEGRVPLEDAVATIRAHRDGS